MDRVRIAIAIDVFRTSRWIELGGCTSHENDTILTEAGAAATGGLFVFVLVAVPLSQRR
jgi:hypothetical protein